MAKVGKPVSIPEIQGDRTFSPHSGETVMTRGVVTGITRRGYFIQDPLGDDDPSTSDAIFVYSPRFKPTLWTTVETIGRVIDFARNEEDHPLTQIRASQTRVIDATPTRIKPYWLTAQTMPKNPEEQRDLLTSLEGMMVGIESGATFVAPSNPFGDYVVIPEDVDGVRTRHGGVRIDPDWTQRWLPGFRVTDYGRAPAVNVGATLQQTVTGPLNYRASSFQIVAQELSFVENVKVSLPRTTLLPDQNHHTVLDLNGFNLDIKFESPDLVEDPRRDRDDDVGDGRFAMLARIVIEQAANPDVIMLQEIQDNDGAEQTDVVDAQATYAELIREIERLGGPTYVAADIAPEYGRDGGQPGGNIRSGYLYNPKRMQLVPGSMQRIGVDDPAFDGCRKPLTARFKSKISGGERTLINVHLASKRHQNSAFSPTRPGFDEKAEARKQQGQIVCDYLRGLRGQDQLYYGSGDFNDFEFSDTLRTLTGADSPGGPESINLVERVPEVDRYDYNHRGVSQVLMHGIVSAEDAEKHTIDYEILHGNELIGTKPGVMGTRPTDHALVLARFDHWG